MKTQFDDPGLAHVLEDLRTKKRLNFEEICDLLFTFKYDDFNEIFKISDMKVSSETYLRIPVYSDQCVAILMIWGKDNFTAIHDHGNYDGRIKILKGSLSEVSYRENPNFIEFDALTVAKEGDVFPEELGGIHSIINNADEISVSLHIYRTEQLNLEGVRVFDTENRKIGYLSSEATSCSWDLPANAYQKIIDI
ncbi:cysteine dioxygenase family protein [Kaistella sp. DKR-2]|uniref:cysteine dioxygenase n=1 Tax=Kaistella soli TaxID=2849654 RepID=UPI001C26E555|nr:cysteine dioxygenase family protein [Kaistella soli]MBU8882590.1 cysteine dioxygenase family protein [Kaistella soli]